VQDFFRRIEMKKLFVSTVLVLLAAFGLSACGDSAALNESLASATATNQRLASSNELLASQLSKAKQENARLTAELDASKRTAQNERDAKWRARNEVAGAQKVAKAATLAAHSVGVKQVSVKR
jgi:hypothetical protein